MQYVVNNRYDADKLSLIFPEDRGEYTIRSLINDTYQKMKLAESSTVGPSAAEPEEVQGPPLALVPAVGMSFLNQAERGGAAAKPQEASVTTPSAPAAAGGGGDQDLARAMVESEKQKKLEDQQNADDRGDEDRALATALAASLEPGNKGRPEGAAEDDSGLATALAASLEKGHEGRRLTPLEQALLEARPLKPPNS